MKKYLHNLLIQINKTLNPYVLLVFSGLCSLIVGIKFVIYISNTLNISLISEKSVFNLVLTHPNILNGLIALLFFYLVEALIIKLVIYIYMLINKDIEPFIRESKLTKFILVAAPPIITAILVLDYDLFTALFALFSFIILCVQLFRDLVKKP